MKLGFSSQLSKVEILALGSRPVAWEDLGIGMCGLSIKLDGQGVDGDGNVGM